MIMPVTATDEQAFAHLDESEMKLVRKFAKVEHYQDHQPILHVGDADIDFFVCETGGIRVLNPTDNNSEITVHGPGGFLGDIDLLTRRPVVVSAEAAGPTTLLRLPGDKLRKALNTMPKLSEKLMIAFQSRRQKLEAGGVAGIRVFGPAVCSETGLIREFLHKNFVPFLWDDTLTDAGKKRFAALPAGTKTPTIVCGNGDILSKPKLIEVAKAAGVWRECPHDCYDFAVIGAGPAGMSAAVYAASEGLKTIVLDRLGPGGQAGGSSKIENFIGFPSGLSGTELATLATLQLLKFGAHLSTPVDVVSMEPAKSPKDPHRLKLDCGNVVQAHVVFVSTGVAWRRLNVPNADRFERAGVYYACTTVEAQSHEGTEVAVVGAGNSAGQAAMFLADNCASTVHLLVRRDKLGDSMSEYLTDRIAAKKNIKVHYFTEVTSLNGTHRLESIDVIHKDTNETERLDCSAVFVFIGSAPHTKWLPPSVKRDELGFLLTGTEVAKSGDWPLTDREPCPLETTMPRLLAGGDVRSGTTKRVGFAVGDGSLAVTCAHKLRSIMGP
jgi:thioredoxin reductase (NADPH)